MTVARHVAGAVGVKPRDRAEIVIDEAGIRYGRAKYQPWSRSWADIASIEVAGSDTAQSTLAGNVLAFGALGLLSGDRTWYYLIVACGDSEVATFQVEGSTPFEVKARLRLLEPAAARLVETAPAVPSVDGLARLVELHNAGELTDEEFTAAKRQMLGLA